MTTSARKFMMISRIVKLVRRAAKLTDSTMITLKACRKPHSHAIKTLENFHSWLHAYFIITMPCYNSPLREMCNTIPHMKRANTIQTESAYVYQTVVSPYRISSPTKAASIPCVMNKKMHLATKLDRLDYNSSTTSASCYSGSSSIFKRYMIGTSISQ